MLYATQPELLTRLLAILDSPQDCAAVGSWHDVQRHAPRSRCIVLADRAPSRSGLPDRARLLRQSVGDVPMIFVTNADLDNARALIPVGAMEVVWLHDVHTTLTQAVERALRRQPLARLGAALGGASHLPLYLRNALGLLFESPRPIRSIRELCALAGCHRTTLWTQWRGIRTMPPTLRLQDVVDWALLVRACDVHQASRSWMHTAEAVGVHEHTLARLARRLMRCQLRSLRPPTATLLVRREFERLLQPLFVPPPDAH